MPVSCADYERPPDEVEEAKPKLPLKEETRSRHRPAPAEPIKEATATDFNAWVLAASAALAQFVQQLNRLGQSTVAPVEPMEPGNPPQAGQVQITSQTLPQTLPPLPPSQLEQPEQRAIPFQSGADTRDSKNRIDVAANGARQRLEETEEMEALLDRSIRLLDAITSHPAFRNAAAMQRQLEELESRVAANFSGNT
jgi:hypothetical protein